MAIYVLADLNTAILSRLSAAASLIRTYNYDEIPEGIHDYPSLMVYPEENTGTDWTGETDRITLSKAGSRGRSIKEYVFHADLYAHQLGTLPENMEQFVNSINELEDILDLQDYPLFGRNYVASFRWSWRRVVFEYAGVNYIGVRIIIVVRCGTDIGSG